MSYTTIFFAIGAILIAGAVIYAVVCVCDVCKAFNKLGE